MQSLDTPHTRLGATYLGLCIIAVLVLWGLGLRPLEILVAVGGSMLLIAIGIASGLYYGDAEGA